MLQYSNEKAHSFRRRETFKVNYPDLKECFTGASRARLPASTTCFAGTESVSAGSAVSTDVASD